MKLMNLSKKVKQGFTLVEILLVVGFIALAGVGVYVIYNKVQLGNSANSENRNIDTLRAGVKNLFAASPDTTGLTNTVVNQAQVTPTPMRGAAIGTITNSFGGAVTIAPLTLTNPNDGFRIQYDAIPAAVCVKLATGTGSQFERVQVAGVDVKALGTNTSVNIATATAQCNTDAGTGVTLFFDSMK